MMAMEYHQPSLDLRAKEGALNLACSLLRPVNNVMRECIAEVATANKIQLNMKLGNDMLNELPFYELDTDRLQASDDEDEGQDDGDNEDKLQALVRE